jgi:4-amino-4-deoxy-L-arabinose transferase-like glycosyltransferase
LAEDSPGESSASNKGANIKRLLSISPTWVGALALMLLAISLRLPQLGWGLPEILEEATPLRQAWEMWGRGGFDLNPHFFNYPGLMIYLNLLGQGVLYLVLSLVGTVGSPMDFQTIYFTDPGLFLLTGRGITVLFAAGTVGLLAGFGKHIGSTAAALTAAFLLAINVFHLTRSQLVAVDLPLTFFVTASLLLALRLREKPHLKHYLLSGVAVGLATATKYTGALCLLPLVTAHLLRLKDDTPLSHRKLLLPAALATTVIIFLIAAPYTLLDFNSFRSDLMLEMQHMQRGHFGQNTGGLQSIFPALGQRLLGWPLLLLALSGAVTFAVVKRQPWALIILAFTLPYLLILLSWKMQADRYLLPLLPPLILLAAAMLRQLLPRGRNSRRRYLLIMGGGAILLSLPPVATLPAALQDGPTDTRLQAREWFARNVPTGTYLVTEQQGPTWLDVVKLQLLDIPLRESVLASRPEQAIYAITTLPMYQVAPERSAIFYDPALYRDVDLVLTSSAVRSRYQAEPERFDRQCAFYAFIELSFRQVARFSSPDGSSPTLIVYQNPRHRIPFGGRVELAGPGRLSPGPGAPLSGEEALFYLHQGLTYEAFAHFPQALQAYETGFEYPETVGGVRGHIQRGMNRCLDKKEGGHLTTDDPPLRPPDR